MSKYVLIFSNPRVTRLLAWCVAALSGLGLLYFYRADVAAAGFSWGQLREHTAGIMRPPSSTEMETKSKHAPEAKFRDLPDEFYSSSDYQRHCAKFYGVGYLTNTIERRVEFCKDTTTTSLVCYHADDLGRWDTDPLCVARGVDITAKDSQPQSRRAAGPKNQLSIRMQCDLRNFTEERQQSKEAEAVLKGIHGVEDIGSYYFDTGAGDQLRDWTFTAEATACSKENNDGQWYLLARREGNNNLWHKLMEIWQAALSVQALWMALDPITSDPLLTAEQRARMLVVFEDDRSEFLDGVWTMVTGNAPVRRADLAKPLCPGNVVLPLAGSSSPFWALLTDGHDHEACETRTLMKHLVSRTLAALGFDGKRAPLRVETDIHFRPNVTIINRTSTRVFARLDEYIKLLQQRNPGVVFNVVDFGAISLPDQIRLVQETDVLVGHHGAGMAHVMFLPPGAAAVEIFPPPRFNILGFHHIARMRGVTHFVGHSVWKEEWDAAVNGVPVPASFKPPDMDRAWQKRPFSYILEDEFVRLVEAAIQSQTYRSSNIWE